MKEQAPFDVAIIGTGPGGYVAAIRAGQLGLKTAVIEKDTRFGGTCLLRGCIPTKALLRDAHLFQEIKKAAQAGLFKTGEVEHRFRKDSGPQERRRRQACERCRLSSSEEQGHGLQRLRHDCCVPTRLRLRADGTSTEVIAKNIIIATGSEAKSLPGYDVDEKRIISNVGALDLTQIPKSMLIVGGGAVGVEFASIYNSFGTKVTLLEVLPNIVPLEDEESFQRIETRLHEEGNRGLYEGEAGRRESEGKRRRGHVSDRKGRGQESHRRQDADGDRPRAEHGEYRSGKGRRRDGARFHQGQ